ncbi:MAG: hypothetical protein V2B19_32770 [Pseudomonadota bacterium]
MRIKLLLINSALSLLLFFIVYQTYQLWQKSKEARSSPPLSISLPKNTGVKAAVAEKTPKPQPVERTAIEMNLFSPERTEYIPPPPEKKEEIKTTALPGKKISLFGIVMTDHYQKALITDPYSEAGKSPYRWVKAGDTIGDYQVRAIQDQGITVANAGSVYQVLLYDGESGKQRSVGETNAPQQNVPTVIQSSADNDKTNPANIAPTVIKSPAGADNGKQPEDIKDKPKTDQTHDSDYIKTPFGTMKPRKK